MKSIYRIVMLLALLAFLWVGSLMLEGSKQPSSSLILLGIIALILFGIMITSMKKL